MLLSRIGIRKFFASHSVVTVAFRVKLAEMKVSCSDAQSSDVQRSDAQSSDARGSGAQICSDQLLLELADCEGKLNAWIRTSSVNAELFAKDPVAAMRAANLGIPEDVLEDLAMVIESISRKLNAAA
jgi:hypothetical protein